MHLLNNLNIHHHQSSPPSALDPRSGVLGYEKKLVGMQLEEVQI